MSSAGSTVPESGTRNDSRVVWGIPLVVLFAIWLWLAFSAGGYIPHQWLLPSVTLGFFGLVVSLLVAYPRRPRQLSLAVLLLFGLYSVWVAFSALWADSPTRAWMEGGRTFTYLLILALALTFLTDAGARRLFRYLLMAAAAAVLAVSLVKVGTADSITGLFMQNRFNYPVTYVNNNAALFLIAFWPLMWLAAGPKEHAPVRGVALGLATGLLGLALMTQSRGAIWSLGITVGLMFVISPARLRTLLYLLVPALLMVYQFPRLNRYWSEGPEAVGGAPAVQTIVTACVAAVLIGTVLAVLERWIKVSHRMKAVFGVIVIVAVVGGAVYGVFDLTRDAGGPAKWVSQTWRQFTGQVPEQTEDSVSRLTLVKSSGRVGIWKVAVQEVEQRPALGVGADNFVYQYDRLRPNDRYTPQQAHSYELQVLGETGIVGGVLAFGGILLVLVGVLWPRCAAGWRLARNTWLRPRRPAGGPEDTRAIYRQNDSRWGDDPAIYGWQMALLCGAAYWLIHASVDWLWQMGGVSIPAVLLVAAAVAGVDAKAGVLWPRLSRRSRMGSSEPGVETALAGPGDRLPLPRPDVADDSDGLLLIPHRADQYADRIERRRRRAEKRRRSRELFRPPGILSHFFRLFLVAVSLIVIIFAGLPYISMLYQDSAKALARKDAYRAAERAEAAAWLLPTDPGPYSTQASIYGGAALQALESDDPGRAGATLDNLALAIGSLEDAIALEPADWTLRFQAGVTTLDLILARGYAEGQAFSFDYTDLSPEVTGLRDWSALAAVEGQLPAPGTAAASLAGDEDRLAVATRYRDLTTDQLAAIALDFLGAADERNPLADQVDAILQRLAMLSPYGD